MMSDIGVSRWRPAMWLLALFLVASGHAGGIALALTNWTPVPEDDEDSAAFVMELAPITEYAPAPETERPPGPPTEDSIETPEVNSVEKAVEPEVHEEVPEVPRVAEVPEDLVLPERTEKPPEEKPKEEEPAQVQQKAAVSVASAAAIAAAPPKTDEVTPEAKKSVAPVLGLSDRDRRLSARWQAALVAQLNRHKRFPDAARRKDVAQQVMVRFSIDRTGRVMAAVAHVSSGSPILDNEAVQMLLRASPLPSPPEHMKGETLELIVPVLYKTKD